MREALVIGAVVILFATSTPPSMGGAPPSKEPNAAYAACMAKASTTADMEACQKAGLIDANRRLDASYALALASFPADQQAKLREAEQTWTVFRQQDCDTWRGSDSGSMTPVAIGDCLVGRTEARIGDLEGFARK